MTLREVTRAVINRVENASGCPVVMNEDASLKTLAGSRIARGGNRIHTITFNPSAVSEPDYVICYQCGFILGEEKGTGYFSVVRSSVRMLEALRAENS
jgi:hypothetical protein